MSSLPAPPSLPLNLTGLAALAALGLLLLFLPQLLALDSALWRTILLRRPCGADEMVKHVVDSATVAAVALLAVAALLSFRKNGARDTWPPLAVCAVGLHANHVMKNVFARERPSTLPDVAPGHSFPSGHVMNTALAALAVLVLVSSFRHPRRWWAVAAVLLAIVFAGRLLVAAHWFTDALGGALAALALIGLCLPPFRRRPLMAPAMLAASLTALLALHTQVRALDVRLPSPLSSRESAAAHVGVSGPLDTSVLHGGWEEQVDRFPRPHAWLHGAGSIGFDLPAAAVGGPHGDRQSAAAAPPALLTLAGRPDVALHRCVHLAVAVNGHALPPFVSFVGWREYRLPVPPAELRPGPNQVTVAAHDCGGKPVRFAFEYLQIDLDRTAADGRAP